MLASLLVRDAFAQKPEIPSARVFLGSSAISLPVSPAARSIPRYELDEALLQATRESGVHVIEGCAVLQVEAAAGGNFVVRTGTGAFAARTAVNAAGRWSQLTEYRPETHTKWIGVKAHFREPEPSRSVDLYFFAGGYCGVQPIGGDTVNAAAMVRAETASSLEQVLASTPELWRRSRNWEQLFPTITTSPLYFRTPQTDQLGVMQVGDAAAFIDPFAGDGISLALHSGRLASESLSGVWKRTYSLEEALRRYREDYKKRFAPAFRNASRLRAFLTAPAWIRSGLLGLLSKPMVAAFVVGRTRAR